MAKTVERVVTHPKLYLAVKGKLQHIKAGTKITVTEDQLKGGLGRKTADPSTGETVDVSVTPEAVKAAADEAAEAIKAAEERATKAEAEAKAAVARAAKAEEALVKSATAAKTAGK